MKQTAASKKAEAQNIETTIVAKEMPAWAKTAKAKSIENREKMMETGLFFQGKAGEKVRGIFLEAGMSESTTKGGSEVFAIKVLRISSHKEQTMTVLQGITTIVDKILAIAEKNNWDLHEVVFDATFAPGKTGNFIKDIVEVPVPQMEAV